MTQRFSHAARLGTPAPRRLLPPRPPPLATHARPRPPALSPRRRRCRRTPRRRPGSIRRPARSRSPRTLAPRHGAPDPSPAPHPAARLRRHPEPPPQQGEPARPSAVPDSGRLTGSSTPTLPGRLRGRRLAPPPAAPGTPPGAGRPAGGGGPPGRPPTAPHPTPSLGAGLTEGPPGAGVRVPRNVMGGRGFGPAPRHLVWGTQEMCNLFLNTSRLLQKPEPGQRKEWQRRE